MRLCAYRKSLAYARSFLASWVKSCFRGLAIPLEHPTTSAYDSQYLVSRRRLRLLEPPPAGQRTACVRDGRHDAPADRRRCAARRPLPDLPLQFLPHLHQLPAQLRHSVHPRGSWSGRACLALDPAFHGGWGILFTIQTLYTNCMGGKDVTSEILASVVGPQRASGIMAQAHKPQAYILLWLLRIFVLLIPLSISAAIASVESHPHHR